MASATVVQVNYRLSRRVCYPTPIHDVLAGYDWIVEHLVPKHTYFSTSRQGKRTFNNARLYVCGELIGGSLASMLALTECRIGSKGIGAAFVNNPIVDWVSLEDFHSQLPALGDRTNNKMNASQSIGRSRCRKSRPRTLSHTLFASNSCLPTSSLLSARSKLFGSTSSYFDPFASPILFFRTTGVIPAASHDCDEPSSPPLIGGEEKVTTIARKAYLKYPPSYTALRLPTFLIGVGAQNPLRDQGEEFAALLRRTHRIGKSSSKEDPDLAEPQSDHDSVHGLDAIVKTNVDRNDRGSQPRSTARESDLGGKVQLKVKDGVGLWDGSNEDRNVETVAEVNQWLLDANQEPA
ncbi:MAG: hypothetical protein Q9157_005930 [Trypethelium eluteriae]